MKGVRMETAKGSQLASAKARIGKRRQTRRAASHWAAVTRHSRSLGNRSRRSVGAMGSCGAASGGGASACSRTGIKRPNNAPLARQQRQILSIQRDKKVVLLA